ncbi:MAG TPA: hypothetical protein VN442_02875, partial [Bryobacteraceae bacterium]|nr:hypothetical protein [Bryobacteraceae bacterium]
MQCTLDEFEREYGALHLVHAVVAHWASRTPDALALINHDRGREVTWRYFDEASTALARQLVRMG